MLPALRQGMSMLFISFRKRELELERAAAITLKGMNAQGCINRTGGGEPAFHDGKSVHQCFGMGNSCPHESRKAFPGRWLSLDPSYGNVWNKWALILFHAQKKKCIFHHGLDFHEGLSLVFYAYPEYSRSSKAGKDARFRELDLEGTEFGGQFLDNSGNVLYLGLTNITEKFYGQVYVFRPDPSDTSA